MTVANSCRLVARDVKPRREGPREDLFAATPPLEGKRASFAFVSAVREKRREQGQDGVGLMFIDVTVAQLNSKCDEEEGVELRQEVWEVCEVEVMVIWNEKGSVWMGGRQRKKSGK